MSLHVESIGAGPDLVLLHGWAMHSGIWRDVRDDLAQHFRLHLVDLPGHGFSSGFSPKLVPACIPGSPGGALKHIVEMVAVFLPANCIVCGWSLGGQIAIELALREPVRVKEIALISTTPCFVKCKDPHKSSQHDWDWGMDAATLQLFAQNLKRDYRTTMKRFLTLQVSGASDIRVLAQLRKNLLERGDPDEAALEAGLQVLLSSDLREKIKNINQPVLIFHGENDAITHPDAARWMHQQLRNSELIMLPDCGHVPFLSYPDQFTNSLVRLSRSGN
ncbi:pimeloyl-ACP methyl ester esterase BioH [Nitrosovibrio sp. Nv6]|uniref:pimeloyl-ACP methyl ester esterase BioH n=1 Tax=Nitrosovibrio sp. Nv6 TaxID=1855340 RepID=UPI0008B8C565|nr:pimeloyl-ACP methyl ester esterase BioH [Nitrosovibrio sp. Nv6]SEO36164.1 pimeloyl-[acyl-carrier protein] methyl ester esterase [Nitrosovibrio sp. Nv6]